MGHRLEPARCSNAILEFARETLFELDHLRAPRANQVMVMSVVALSQQLETANAVPQIEPLYHPHAFQQMHRPINRRQIAVATG